MNSLKTFHVTSLSFSHVLGVAIMAAVAPALCTAQDESPRADTHTFHTAESGAAGDVSLAKELRSLRSKVAALEAALEENHQGTVSTAPGAAATHRKMQMPVSGKGMMGGRSMGMMGGMSGGDGPDTSDMPDGTQMGMGGMGMMGGTSGGRSMGMGGMSKGGGMGMMDMNMMGMMGQNPAQGSTPMGGMAMLSALPGFPGASHLYHIGAAGFFLNHSQHISLTTEQQTQLNRVKEQALLAQAKSQREIGGAEQELWELTSADQPDAGKIEAKVREIEKLRGDQRLAFIRAVGEAAKVLTPEQIKSLVGQAPLAGHTDRSAPQHQP